MTHVLLVQGWARWCSQLSYRPPLSTDEKTGSQTTWITQDHTTVRSWADNLKACWSGIRETPESQLPHVYMGVLVLPHYTLVNTSWNNEHYSLWYTVGTHWMFAFPVPCRNLSTGYAKWMWVEWHWIYPIAPTQAFVGDIIWMLLVTPNLSDSLPFWAQMSIIWTALSLSGVQVPRADICLNSWGMLFKFYFIWIAPLEPAVWQPYWLVPSSLRLEWE